MVINRKILIGVAATAVVLFIVANPLGDSHHGLGKHNTFLAGLGQTLFVASIVIALIFLVLALTALVQFGLRRSRSARN